MTNQNNTIIITFIAVIIVTIASFALYSSDIITIEVGQFAAIFFATIAGLLTIASCTELNRQTVAITENR